MIFKRAGLILVSAITLFGFAAANTPIVNANSYFGGNGRIVFYAPVTLDNPGQEIYTVKPDGTDLQQVTSNAFADANPQWAPSGDKIAFDRHLLSGSNQQDIYIQNINSDGTANGAATVVSGANTTEREFDPSWSPDGTKIAFHRAGVVGGVDPNPYQIFVIDSVGGGLVRVTNDTNYADTEPTWNKDGNYLVFKHSVSPGSASAIAFKDPTTNDAPQEIDSEASGSIGSPQWSPVDNKVVYIKNSDVYVYDMGLASTRLLASGSYSAPTWSPDGKLIAVGLSNTITYLNAETGAVVAVKTVASSPGQTNEVDWARADAPPSTTHECTTSVNQDCTTFTPEIPAACQNITTAATHGTPKYEGSAFLFTPEADYVGTDNYVYSYYDENMNTITCTVNITVLPQAPASGSFTGKNIQQYVVITALVIAGGLILRRRLSPR